MSAQANIDRVTENLRLIQNNGDLDPILKLIAPKNVDDQSPGIQQIMKDYGYGNKHQHNSFLSQVYKLITGQESLLTLFASKAAGPGLE